MGASSTGGLRAKEQMAPKAATLLFCHGAGFCKEVWEPVMRHLQASPLLQRTPCDFVSFDFSFHGSNRKSEPKPELYYLDAEAKASPRLKHPGNTWPQWAAKEAYQQATNLLADHKRPVIGIGHSMGGAALWAAEAFNPGTFHGLSLFEPIYLELPGREKAQDFLVSLTLAREGKWRSRSEAEKHFAEFKNFANWDREALASYLKGALVDEADGSVSLACQPDVEASMYCATPLKLSDEELAQPNCPITFHSGERTRLFDFNVFADFEKRFPDVYTVAEPIPKTAHVMVMEDPETSAKNILQDLSRLPLFQ